MTLAVDVGGTFTDLALWQNGTLEVGKVLTTADQSEGVMAGAAPLLAAGPASALLHGTTVATNTVLERTGARVALVTSAGLEDLLEIGRQDRPSLYDPFSDRPEPLVPRELRLAASTPLRPGGLAIGELVEALTGTPPEAVAVCLLYGYAHPEEEEAIAAALASKLTDVPMSLAGRVAPEFREYERTSTTVLNAYLMPLLAGYLRRLEARVSTGGLAPHVLLMRSSGGLMDVPAATELPAAVLLSGPAAGAVAAAAVGEAHGLPVVVSFDMGGTSTDVCRIENARPRLAFERDVGGHPCRLASVAVHTVGAGGGSIAWLDTGGALRVGPRSAGASPGPACYGRGGSVPTVTDAHVVLGRIGARARLGGEVLVRKGLAEKALQTVGGPAGPAEAAAGIIEVADARMEQAIRRVTTEEGSDPRGAWLVAFGGAGGLHGGSLARRFGMEGVIVPPHAGVFSAIGLLLSPLRSDTARSLPFDDVTLILSTAAELESDVRRRIVEMGGGSPDASSKTVEVRYLGQSHETPVPLFEGDRWTDIADRFHAEHQRQNGFSRPSDPIEVVTVRAEATSKPVARWGEMAWSPEPEDSRSGSRKVRGRDGKEIIATVHWRPRLQPGVMLPGPALVEEPDATTLIAEGEVARVLEDGSLQVTW